MTGETQQVWGVKEGCAAELRDAGQGAVSQGTRESSRCEARRAQTWQQEEGSPSEAL